MADQLGLLPQFFRKRRAYQEQLVYRLQSFPHLVFLLGFLNSFRIFSRPWVMLNDARAAFESALGLGTDSLLLGNSAMGLRAKKNMWHLTAGRIRFQR